MGPAHSSSDMHSNTIEPPKFVTNQTNKVQYKDALSIWTDIIRSFAKFDHKSQGRLDMIGLIVYMSCDAEAKAKLRAAETEGLLKLKGDANDPDRKKLITQILNTIAAESASEKIQREVSLLNDIHQCTRQTNETPETYANRFDAKVATYVHQKSDKNSSSDQQWALLLIQNAKLTPDTRNSITFQLTTGAAMRKHPITTLTTTIHTSILQELIRAHQETNSATDEIARNTTQETIGRIIHEIIDIVNKQTAENIPTITFAEAISVLRQVKISTEHAPVSTLLAKRPTDDYYTNAPRKRSRIEQIKATTKCIACGKVGHWFKDNPRCLHIIELRNKNHDNQRGGDRKEGGQNPSTEGAFFRPRGQ